jgi:D-beta-D-heptose 7-phosphate kinase/D-beta-D-heptose 1-phosphate adenosyltransferase
MKQKIIGEKELLRIIKNLKTRGKRIVFTNGCFDLLHIGHIRYLEKARTLGDILVVGVNSDSSVRILKGPKRPILPVKERAEILSGLGCVDYITIFNEQDPLKLITSLHPHVLVKGGDWTKEQIVGGDVVERSGGKVVIIPFVKGTSTSNLIGTILKKYEKRGKDLYPSGNASPASHQRYCRFPLYGSPSFCQSGKINQILRRSPFERPLDFLSGSEENHGRRPFP